MPIIFDKGNQSAKAGTELMMLYLQDHLDPKLQQSFSIGRAIKLFHKDTKKIYWCHNIPGQRMPSEVMENATLLSKDRWELIDGIVFVSEWQRQLYIKHFNFTEEDIRHTKVLRNAIIPIEEHNKLNDKIRLIYTPVPFRGLDMLITAFEHLQKYHDNLELEVFSSVQLYGVPAQIDQVLYRNLYQRLENNPDVIYHGTKPNNEVRDGLKRSHIFAYPSNYQETSCISLIEAMSAGCLCVHPNLAGLPETAGNQTMMYEYTTNKNDHINRFIGKMNEAITSVKDNEVNTTKQKQFADEQYSWDKRIIEWNDYLKNLL